MEISKKQKYNALPKFYWSCSELNSNNWLK